MKNIILGLLCVMIANVLLGSSIATLKKEFCKKTFWNGVIKFFFIMISICLMYACSYLNPQILVANIGGQDVNLIVGMKLLFIAGIVMYGYKDLVKLRDLLKINTKIEERNEESEKNIQTEDDSTE